MTCIAQACEGKPAATQLGFDNSYVYSYLESLLPIPYSKTCGKKFSAVNTKIHTGKCH